MEHNFFPPARRGRERFSERAWLSYLFIPQPKDEQDCHLHLRFATVKAHPPDLTFYNESIFAEMLEPIILFHICGICLHGRNLFRLCALPC
jgi:hypothetical protein